jgi:hypothetical protein
MNGAIILGLVGVNAGRGQDGRELPCESGDRLKAGGADHVGGAEDGHDARGEGPADGVRPVGIELGHVEVGVGINEPYPGGTCTASVRVPFVMQERLLRKKRGHGHEVHAP